MAPNPANQLMEVLAFFDREYPEDHPYSSITPSPDVSLRPELFMLGSSEGGMHQCPYSILSAIVVCAETDEAAEFLAGPAQLQWARWGTGQIHHDPPTLEEAVDRLAAQVQIDELMVVNMITDHEAQMRSHEFIAEAFGLRQPAASPQESATERASGSTR